MVSSIWPAEPDLYTKWPDHHDWWSYLIVTKILRGFQKAVVGRRRPEYPESTGYLWGTGCMAWRVVSQFDAMTCSACVMCLCWGFSNFSLRESMLYDSDNLPLRTGHYFILKCRKYLNWICFCFYDRIISACRFRRAFNIDLSWVSLDKRRNCNGIARGFRAIGKLTWFRCGGWRQRRPTSDDNLNEKSINLLENPSWTLLQLNWPS